MPIKTANSKFCNACCAYRACLLCLKILIIMIIIFKIKMLFLLIILITKSSNEHAKIRKFFACKSKLNSSFYYLKELFQNKNNYNLVYNKIFIKSCYFRIAHLKNKMKNMKNVKQVKVSSIFFKLELDIFLCFE